LRFTQGIVNSPAQFGLGVAKGTGSLLKNTTYALFNTASKLTSTVAKGEYASLFIIKKHLSLVWQVKHWDLLLSRFMMQLERHLLLTRITNESALFADKKKYFSL
jgi:hypothetical protein